MEEDSKFTVSALNWLYEMEALESPVLMTNLQENIYLAHPGIKNVEILIFEEYKQILIYLEINFISKLLRKNNLISDLVGDIIKNLLPSFKYRVVFDKEILTQALKKAKEVYGGQNEDISPTNDIHDKPTSNPINTSADSSS